MRSRRSAQDDMAALARRRLELLTAELAGLRDPMSAQPPPADAETNRHDPEDREARAEEVHADAPVEEPLAWDSRPPPRGRHARRPVSAPGRVGGWLHDRLPPTLQGRVLLTPGHLSVVALLVAGAFAVTAWWVVRADSPGTPVPAETWSETAATAGSASMSPLVTPVADPSATANGASGSGVVVVDVEGKVRRPGIVTLPIGSRVVDALEAAGGSRRGVDLTSLNLARVLVDGEQIVVGVKAPGGVAAPAASAGGAASTGGGTMVNINSATESELEELPGVGPVTAAAIVQWRTENGPFSAVDELLEVSGIGDATLADMAPFVTL